MNISILIVASTLLLFQKQQSLEPLPTPLLLIDQLASPNKIANPESEPFVGYPENYDYEAQKVVADAETQLKKLGFNAIPELIKNVDDERYSCTRSYSTLIDFSVGEECFRIVESILSPKVKPDYSVLPKTKIKRIKGYPMRMGVDKTWHYTELSYLDLLIHYDKAISRDANKSIKKSLQTWWKRQAFKTIDHAHLAAVNRLIKNEHEIGFDKDFDKEKYLKPLIELKSKLEKQIQAK